MMNSEVEIEDKFNKALNAARNTPAAIDTQVPPEGTGPAVLPLVLMDLVERARMGREKYGTYLRANNSRDALVDAYQEALDLVMYLRQALIERGLK